jgi:ubiquinone/menaquinone biosynthesis C-methylase UbiE
MEWSDQRTLDPGRGRPGNYAEQALTYDRTRGASPTVVGALATHLGGSNGRSMLDAAGGTGNYAVALTQRGFRVTVLDAEIEMLRRASAKLGPGRTVAGDVQSPPFADDSFDCAVLVNAIHLMRDPLTAVTAMRRVIREGPLLLTAFTRENFASLFVFEYFGLRDEIEGRMSNDELASMLRSGGFVKLLYQSYTYSDILDGSLNALHIDGAALADPARLRNTSFWHRLDEATRRRGIEALRRDLESGALDERVRLARTKAERHGHGTVFAAWP